MSHDSSRKALHAYVSDHAHEQWHGFAAEQGVSVSAILEALAAELHGPGPQDPGSQGREGAVTTNSVELDVVVNQARKIDARRRRRRT